MIKYWINRKIERKIVKIHRQRRAVFKPLVAIKRAVLFAEADDLELLSPLLQELTGVGALVQIWLFGAPETFEEERFQGGEIRLIGKKELVFFGQMPRKTLLREFCEQKTEAIFNLAHLDNRVAVLLTAASQSPLKVGVKGFGAAPYDIMIDSKKQLPVNELVKNMLFYLHRIDIKDNNL